MRIPGAPDEYYSTKNLLLLVVWEKGE